MRAVLQRVLGAEVQADGRSVGRIDLGLLVYVGVAQADTPEQAAKLAEKVANLRIFDDEGGKLNKSVRDVRGGVLAVPNFTLLADARKGRRPAFVNAAAGDHASSLFQAFLAALRNECCHVASGAFGAAMTINSTADGPVNIVLDID